MRKGARTRPWTISEERYLADMAGRVPKREICRHLRRSAKAVERRAARMRREGVPVELRCHVSRDAVCPSCGCASSLMGREGICKPCRKRAQLADIQARIAGLWPLLTQEQRDRYEREDAKLESSMLPRPAPPRIPASTSPYRRSRALEEWRRECERVDAANLERRVRAAQKRKERMAEKVKTNGGFHKSPGEEE